MINKDSFDEKTLSLIKQLMTAVIEVKVEQDGEYLRIMGLRGAGMEWQKFTVNKGVVAIIP
jgi:hypothetical protein